MSRHRNVRNYDYDDDMSEDVYGHSVEDYEMAVSPSTARQFLYSRGDTHQHDLFSHYMGEKFGSVEEEGEDESEGEDPLTYSQDYKRPQLDPVSEAKLASCLDQLQSILGESCHEPTAVDSILKHNFNVEKALDDIFNKETKQDKSISTDSQQLLTIGQKIQILRKISYRKKHKSKPCEISQTKKDTIVSQETQSKHHYLNMPLSSLGPGNQKQESLSGLQYLGTKEHKDISAQSPMLSVPLSSLSKPEQSSGPLGAVVFGDQNEKSAAAAAAGGPHHLLTTCLTSLAQSSVGLEKSDQLMAASLSSLGLHSPVQPTQLDSWQTGFEIPSVDGNNVMDMSLASHSSSGAPSNGVMNPTASPSKLLATSLSSLGLQRSDAMIPQGTVPPAKAEQTPSEDLLSTSLSSLGLTSSATAVLMPGKQERPPSTEPLLATSLSIIGLQQYGTSCGIPTSGDRVLATSLSNLGLHNTSTESLDQLMASSLSSVGVKTSAKSNQTISDMSLHTTPSSAEQLLTTSLSSLALQTGLSQQSLCSVPSLTTAESLLTTSLTSLRIRSPDTNNVLGTSASGLEMQGRQGDKVDTVNLLSCLNIKKPPCVQENKAQDLRPSHSKQFALSESHCQKYSKKSLYSKKTSGGFGSPASQKPRRMRLASRPSLFAVTLCYKSRRQASPAFLLKKKRLSSRGLVRQLSSMALEGGYKYIEPYHFSSPSPDDEIKKQQMKRFGNK